MTDHMDEAALTHIRAHWPTLFERPDQPPYSIHHLLWPLLSSKSQRLFYTSRYFPDAVSLSLPDGVTLHTVAGGLVENSTYSVLVPAMEISRYALLRLARLFNDAVDKGLVEHGVLGPAMAFPLPDRPADASTPPQRRTALFFFAFSRYATHPFGQNLDFLPASDPA